MSKMQDMRVWTEFISARTGTVAGFCGLGNDLGFKRGKELNRLSVLATLGLCFMDLINSRNKCIPSVLKFRRLLNQ